MFGISTNIFQPQAILGISYGFSQLSGPLNGIKTNAVKTISSNTVASQQVLKSSSSTNYEKIIEIKKELGIDENNCAIVINGITIPSLNTHMKQTKSIFKRHLHSNALPWQQSYSSFHTFAENKNGFPADYEDQLLKRVLDNPTFVQSLLYGNNVRHFKTHRAAKETPSQPSIFASIKPAFVDGVRGHDLDKESSQKLNAILSEEPEEKQKRIKLAFAEGYLAAGESSRKQNPLITRIFNSLKYLSIIFLSITAFMLAKQSGVFKLVTGTESEVIPEEISETFDDVIGVDEAKEELQDIVKYLKNPDKFTSLGAELPKGVLLVGSPGTGKTLLARAVAGEASVPFFHAAGSQFDEVLVGQGAKRVRDLFRAAKERSPCVIFIDEIDSVGSKRTSSNYHPYANQTINQLLSEMDGFHKNEGIIVLGATNQKDFLDPAILRPGRFDVEVYVHRPDLAGRKGLFDHYLNKIKAHHDVDSSYMARGTIGMTGADIKNVVNQAALRAVNEQANTVNMKHLMEARDKVLMGPEKKARIPDQEANVITAFHEGGHTIVGYFTKHSDPLHKVTIVPRGQSLGHTANIPAKDQYHRTKREILARIDCLMGGRAAEELTFGTEAITTGASSDLDNATHLATGMVKTYGMSDKVGMRTFPDNEQNNNLDPLSQYTKDAIDSEIKKILNDSYERAKTILRTHSKELKSLADSLLKYETLDADDVKAIVEGNQVKKDL